MIGQQLSQLEQNIQVTRKCPRSRCEPMRNLYIGENPPAVVALVSSAWVAIGGEVRRKSLFQLAKQSLLRVVDNRIVVEEAIESERIKGGDGQGVRRCCMQDWGQAMAILALAKKESRSRKWSLPGQAANQASLEMLFGWLRVKQKIHLDFVQILELIDGQRGC